MRVGEKIRVAAQNRARRQIIQKCFAQHHALPFAADRSFNQPPDFLALKLINDQLLGRRYLIACVLAATVGVIFLVGALILGAGRALPAGLGWTEEFARIWAFVRWPVGVAIVALAVTLLYRFAPRTRLGSGRAVVGGSVVAVILWVVFTGLLSLYFSLRSSTPYGPLLSIVALLVWSMLSSLALHLGIATTCTLSGAPRPRKGSRA